MKKLLLISLGILSCLDSFSAQALNFNASLLDDNLYTQNTLVPDAPSGNDSYQIAKTYFLPDYQAKIVDRASDISKDTGGGDTDKSCSAYGFEACESPKTLRPGASPVHPIQGLDCYKKSDCICPTGTGGYNYSSANCSGNKQPSGDTCNDLYKECTCKDGFTYNSTNCKGEYQLAGESCDDNYQRCEARPCSDGNYSDKTIDGKICSAVTYGGRTCQACRDKTCEEKCSGFQTGVTCAKGQNTETCSSECSSYVKCTGEACPSGVGNCKYGCRTYSTQKDCTDVCLECEKCAPTCTNETDCPYGTETVDNGCGGTCTKCKAITCPTQTILKDGVCIPCSIDAQKSVFFAGKECNSIPDYEGTASSLSCSTGELSTGYTVYKLNVDYDNKDLKYIYEPDSFTPWSTSYGEQYFMDHMKVTLTNLSGFVTGIESKIDGKTYPVVNKSITFTTHTQAEVQAFHKGYGFDHYVFRCDDCYDIDFSVFPNDKLQGVTVWYDSGCGDLIYSKPYSYKSCITGTYRTGKIEALSGKNGHPIDISHPTGITINLDNLPSEVTSIKNNKTNEIIKAVNNTIDIQIAKTDGNYYGWDYWTLQCEKDSSSGGGSTDDPLRCDPAQFSNCASCYEGRCNGCKSGYVLTSNYPPQCITYQDYCYQYCEYTLAMDSSGSEYRKCVNDCNARFQNNGHF